MMIDKLIQIAIIIFIVFVIVILCRLNHTLKLEKRISNFALDSLKEEEISLFDKLSNFFWRLVLKFSKILKKSAFLSNYGERFNKYISYNNKKNNEGINYVSLKIIISLFVIILSIISRAFHYIDLNIMFFVILFLISFFIPDIYLKIEFNQKRKRIEDDLLKAIIIMNNAFGSGRNIMQAIETVKNELTGPIKDEFEKIYLDITYGLSLDVVFERFYERVELEDAKYITTSLTLLNKTGGDIIKVFSLIEKSIFDKKNLRNELKSLTASSEFVFKLLIALPFIFTLIIFILNPTYFNPLFTTPFGIIILVFTTLLYLLYILVVRRIMQVEI